MKGWPPLARRPSEWWAALLGGRGGGLLAGAALARRRDLRAQRRLAFDGDVRAEEVEALLTHTFHLHQIALLLEGAVLRAIVDDALRCFRADARQKRELRDVGGVDVDDAARLRGRRGFGDRRAGDRHDD